jgi:hypothetical protein
MAAISSLTIPARICRGDDDIARASLSHIPRTVSWLRCRAIHTFGVHTGAHLLSGSRPASASPYSPGYARHMPTSSRMSGLYVRLLRLDNNMTPDMAVLA